MHHNSPLATATARTRSNYGSRYQPATLLLRDRNMALFFSPQPHHLSSLPFRQPAHL